MSRDYYYKHHYEDYVKVGNICMIMQLNGKDLKQGDAFEFMGELLYKLRVDKIVKGKDWDQVYLTEVDFARITSELANRIIETREPKGEFYFHDTKAEKWIGIDNKTGDAWTEEFNTLGECFDWLAGYNYEE